MAPSRRSEEKEEGESLYHQLKLEQRKQRQANEDILLLRNRIAHLKKEFVISEKKISETRSRAGQISSQKDGRKLKGDALSSMKQSVVQSQGADVQLYAKQRADGRRKREAHLKKELIRKQELIKQQQEEKDRFKRDKELMQKKSQQENAAKRLARQREVQARKQRLAAKERAKRAAMQKHKHDEFASYKQECEAKVGEISELERMEMELINRLKATQARQRDAYETLESTLAEV